MRRLAPAPAWMTAGWFEADPVGLRIVTERFNMPVASEAERSAANEFILEKTSTSCTSCGRFAFSRLTTCYWCRKAKGAK